MSMKFSNRDFTKKPLTRKDTQIDCSPNEIEDAAKVQQHHNEGGRLDTAKIVSGYFQNGIITHTRDATARYMDATAITDFREAMTIKTQADQAYAQLPDEVKKQFDTQEDFVKFAIDEKNLDKLREWGLAAPVKTTEKPQPIEVIVKNPEPEQPAA